MRTVAAMERRVKNYQPVDLQQQCLILLASFAYLPNKKHGVVEPEILDELIWTIPRTFFFKIQRMIGQLHSIRSNQIYEYGDSLDNAERSLVRKDLYLNIAEEHRDCRCELHKFRGEVHLHAQHYVHPVYHHTKLVLCHTSQLHLHCCLVKAKTCYFIGGKET
jgi:hypothetical protein